jgi:hypothetical protein
VSSVPRRFREWSAIVAVPPSTGDRPTQAGVATPPSRSHPTSESTRVRFALPQLEDPRTDEAIDALLDGATRKRGRPAPDPIRTRGREASEGLESRISWMEALRREDARQARYRRVASIVVLEARSLTDAATATDWLGRIVGPLAHTIRRAARATDRVTRASETRFLVLLPETTEADAAHFAERVMDDCSVWLNAMHAPVAVRGAAAAATATSDASLEDALVRAMEALAPA